MSLKLIQIELNLLDYLLSLGCKVVFIMGINFEFKVIANCLQGCLCVSLSYKNEREVDGSKIDTLRAHRIFVSMITTWLFVVLWDGRWKPSLQSLAVFNSILKLIYLPYNVHDNLSHLILVCSLLYYPETVSLYLTEPSVSKTHLENRYHQILRSPSKESNTPVFYKPIYKFRSSSPIICRLMKIKSLAHYFTTKSYVFSTKKKTKKNFAGYRNVYKHIHAEHFILVFKAML